MIGSDGFLRRLVPSALVLVIGSISALGCAGAGFTSVSDTSKTYRANMDTMLDAVDGTLARLNYRIVHHDEREGSHLLVASREDRPLGRGPGGGRDAHIREMSVRLTEVGPRETRVDIEMPAASAYQAAPNREHAQQFFRILDGMGPEPVE